MNDADQAGWDEVTVNNPNSTEYLSATQISNAHFLRMPGARDVLLCKNCGTLTVGQFERTIVIVGSPY